ncbi:imidazole glycerol phosphate synthase subunit HisH [Paraneptunicella aestuarii]|uniref:imidazole glycerol phosphate synthase subunit HisH n=1 Tax=Paraneptunicella aestuarii TaxID=2831148 RepID=UPI001E3E05F8|nr:imidazole glycerol phosphate synthase subunit HisH [Paraneptunicella aestuarii]UAA39141.1 imidazole glycerol phosphate synthase subunit HisH [Paraneptunicella aestuarii]
MKAFEQEKASSRVTVIDYQCGNLRSVEQALLHCGAEVEVTSDPQKVLNADKLILPGVGAYPVGMSHLKDLGLVEPILHKARQGTPLLGICLGMQLLFEHSGEHGGANGLGLIKGQVKRIQANETRTETRTKLPHIGWNEITIQKDNCLLCDTDYFYFVHTYAAIPEDPEAILASSMYGDVEFCAAVSSGNVWGMQFHPENSSTQGLSILSRFVQL